jgi:hypothetical protein
MVSEEEPILFHRIHESIVRQFVLVRNFLGAKKYNFAGLLTKSTGGSVMSHDPNGFLPINIKRRNTKRQPFIDEVSDTEDEPLNEEVSDNKDESFQQFTDCSEDSEDDWELYNQEDDDVGDFVDNRLTFGVSPFDVGFGSFRGVLELV